MRDEDIDAENNEEFDRTAKRTVTHLVVTNRARRNAIRMDSV